MTHTLGGLHNRVAIWITRKSPQCRIGRIWGYLTIAEAMQDAGIKVMEVYIVRLQNMVTLLIATRLIMYI